MNKTHVAIVLAKAIGKTLTPELAVEIARELFDSPDLARPPSTFEPQKYSAYTFALESFREILPELHDLHVQHYAETEAYRGAPLNPDYAAMAQSEHDGHLMQFTVRCEGRLVGNMRINLTQSTHSQTQQATEDGIFLLPAHRGGFVAVRLWQYVEKCIAQVGVKELFFLSKDSNRSDRLATYLKYQPVGQLFSKSL